MKTQLSFLVSVFLLLSIISSTSYSQRGWKSRGSGGWGHKDNYNQLFDAKTIESLTGTVMEIDSITPMRGMSNGFHLMLKTEKELISVHLGPAWYIENQDMDIRKNDKIEIKGSRITFDGKPAIIASEIRKGDDTLSLRDESGYPTWSGWRKR
jgi:hypothetical protein